ncbi:VOC family protein [Mycobacterium sp. MYCO198283]|uniref:VOC family protein n=1 Tax=Mycobacterium sp. MYCO198283 TaxID=2883505 RepID=UPI001E47B4F1|nr:VOC family protein [Mycobacterium sp. MYCO198283]MCG5433287.1 VOC family protein [Mycobacterium sp. MYCO198283]
MSSPVGTLVSVSVDCPDPDALAPFYRDLLGLQEGYARPDRSVIALVGAGVMLTFMRVDDYTPPNWPGGPQHQQLHLDISVDDLPAAVEAAVRLGAREAPHQPSPQVHRVLLDPVGHPFCLTSFQPDGG